MQLSSQLARQFREVYFGGNWTSVDIKGALEDLTWEEATRRDSLNSIATLVFHINYYVSAVLKVLKGGPLDAKDKLSFDLPPITSEEEWQQLIKKNEEDAKEFALLVEQLPEDMLDKVFVDEKYGSYYRNLQGIVEHTHYHLGQIVILKKLLRAGHSKL